MSGFVPELGVVLALADRGLVFVPRDPSMQEAKALGLVSSPGDLLSGEEAGAVERESRGVAACIRVEAAGYVAEACRRVDGWLERQGRGPGERGQLLAGLRLRLAVWAAEPADSVSLLVDLAKGGVVLVPSVEDLDSVVAVAVRDGVGVPDEVAAVVAVDGREMAMMVRADPNMYLREARFWLRAHRAASGDVPVEESEVERRLLAAWADDAA